MTQLLDPELFLPEPEPAEVRATIISVDDHLVEPPDLFEGRLPAKLQDRAPKVVVDRAGHEVWEFDGQRHSQVGMNAVVGRRPETVKVEPFRFDQMRPGCFDIDARVRGHGPQRRVGVAQLPVDDHRVLRPGVLAVLRPGARPRHHAGVQRLGARRLVAAPPGAHHPARHHLAHRPGGRRRGDPAQRRARVPGRHAPRAAPPDRAAVDLRRALGADPPGVRGDRHGGLPARRLERPGRAPAGLRPGDHAARRHAVRPALAAGLHRVAVGRVDRALPRAAGGDGRGRHRLGGDAARPPRQHRRPLRLRARVGRAPGRRAAPRLLVLHDRRPVDDRHPPRHRARPHHGGGRLPARRLAPGRTRRP